MSRPANPFEQIPAPAADSVNVAKRLLGGQGKTFASKLYNRRGATSSLEGVSEDEVTADRLRGMIAGEKRGSFECMQDAHRALRAAEQLCFDEQYTFRGFGDLESVIHVLRAKSLMDESEPSDLVALEEAVRNCKYEGVVARLHSVIDDRLYPVEIVEAVKRGLRTRAGGMPLLTEIKIAWQEGMRFTSKDIQAWRKKQDVLPDDDRHKYLVILATILERQGEDAQAILQEAEHIPLRSGEKRIAPEIIDAYIRCQYDSPLVSWMVDAHQDDKQRIPVLKQVLLDERITNTLRSFWINLLKRYQSKDVKMQFDVACLVARAETLNQPGMAADVSSLVELAKKVRFGNLAYPWRQIAEVQHLSGDALGAEKMLDRARDAMPGYLELEHQVIEWLQIAKQELLIGGKAKVDQDLSKIEDVIQEMDDQPLVAQIRRDMAEFLFEIHPERVLDQYRLVHEEKEAWSARPQEQQRDLIPISCRGEFIKLLSEAAVRLHRQAQVSI